MRPLSTQRLVLVAVVTLCLIVSNTVAQPIEATDCARKHDSVTDLTRLPVDNQDDYLIPKTTSRIVLIRHAEKRKHNKPGLSRRGRRRAQCLRKVLGPKSKYDFGLIIAQSFNPHSEMRKRPFETVQPLAKDLGLEVKTSCERDDPKCVIKLIQKFEQEPTNKGKDVLICWKHSFLHVIANALGEHDTTAYPDDREAFIIDIDKVFLNRFDILWVLQNRKIVSKESEHCPKLDRQHRRKEDDKDPDLNTHISQVQQKQDEQNDEFEESQYLEYDEEQDDVQEWLVDQSQQLSLD
ncbi:hypothetical protein OIO90_004263 [Microbotryomycetes sp. JL221]|nr:hypothetical protein OIO90_004263 [Microbotryomycetes sp. JL221]